METLRRVLLVVPVRLFLPGRALVARHFDPDRLVHAVRSVVSGRRLPAAPGPASGEYADAALSSCHGDAGCDAHPCRTHPPRGPVT